MLKEVQVNIPVGPYVWVVYGFPELDSNLSEHGRKFTLCLAQCLAYNRQMLNVNMFSK